MTLDNIVNSFKLKNWFKGQLGYVANGLHLFNGEQLLKVEDGTKIPKILIVAKCHFSESWQTFPSVNRKELTQILSHKENAQQVFGIQYQVYKNDKIDGFDVRTVTLEPALVNKYGTNKIYLPETDILATMQEHSLCQVDTPAGLLFCANTNGVVKSSYAKGIVANIETYKLTVGLPSNVNCEQINQVNFAQHLLSSLLSLPIPAIAQMAIYNIKHWFNWTQLHLLYWAPLLTVLCFYIVVNGYYLVKENQIEQALAMGGDEVQEVLAQKRTLDKNRNTLELLATEFNDQSFVHYHWLIIEKLINKKMTIKRITFDEPNITIRGTAEKASDILATISNVKSVKSATFEGAVRKSRGKDSFVLLIEVKDEQ